MRFDIDGEFKHCIIMQDKTNTFSGERQCPPASKSGGQMTYDPDLARAAAFNNAQGITVPPDISERKLLTKIDLRVIPCLSVLYLMAFLDRTNIANAGLISSKSLYIPLSKRFTAVFELREDLALGGLEYNTALVIFFVPYILFEIPSNFLLKRLKPHVWLSVCMFGFGLVTICQGLVTNYGGLVSS